MTARPFSYNVLKNVIGYLDVEKRIQIALHYPSLTTAERKTDLTLENLLLDDAWLIVNQIKYIVNAWHLPVNPGQLCVAIQRKQKVLKQLVIDNTTNLIVVRKLLDLFLANRRVVKVKVLTLPRLLTCLYFNLPEGLKLDCEEVRLQSDQTNVLSKIRPFLFSFPIKKLSIQMYEGTNQQHQVLFQEELVQTARCLELRKDIYSNRSILETLMDLRNAHVHVETRCIHKFNKNDVVILAESWKERCPELGTLFTLTVSEYDYVLDVMDEMSKDLGAVPGEVLEEELRTSALRHCVTIPLKSGHELNVFGGRNINKKKETWCHWLLRMEVMKKGSSKRRSQRVIE